MERRTYTGPINMTDGNVESIELGRKGATRRIVKAGNSIVTPGSFKNLRLATGRAKNIDDENVLRARCAFESGERAVSIRSKIKAGDLLWVRKGWHGATRAASTLTLEIWSVEVSRLQDLTEQDAIDEGVHHPPWNELLWVPHELEGGAHVRARDAFRTLWTQIFGPKSWEENPWVWTYRFHVHRMNVDTLLRMWRTHPLDALKEALSKP